MGQNQPLNFYRTLLCVPGLWFLCSAQLAYAGAWALPSGKGQIISTNTYDTANRAYEDQSGLTRDVAFKKTDSRIFMEHGLTHKITLVLETAFQDIDYTAREGRTQKQGFGNSVLGARYQFLKKEKNVASIQAAFILAGNGENIADADLGRGGNGLEIRGLYGRSFKLGPRNGFADIQTAWIYRSGNSPDSYKVDGTLGLDATRKFQILGQLFYARTSGQTIGVDRVLPNETLKAQTSIVFKRSERRSYQIGYFETVAGRNIVKENAVFFGLWQRY